MSFDHKRPHGQISPQMIDARFEQDGKLYTVDGALCDRDGKRIVAKPAEPEIEEELNPAPGADADHKSGSASMEQKLQSGDTPADELPPEEKQPEPGSVNGDETAPIDLVGWANRTTNYQWFSVKAEIKAKYGSEFTTAEEARAFLLNLPPKN
jgi:hypothetical protein